MKTLLKVALTASAIACAGVVTAQQAPPIGDAPGTANDIGYQFRNPSAAPDRSGDPIREIEDLRQRLERCEAVLRARAGEPAGSPAPPVVFTERISTDAADALQP